MQILRDLPALRAAVAALKSDGKTLALVPTMGALHDGHMALVEEARAFCAVVASKSRKALVIAKEALNGLEPRDVDRGYRWEQGFTLEMYMHEDSQRSRDAFVATGTTAKF